MRLAKRIPCLLALAIFTCLCGTTLQAQSSTNYLDSFSGGSSRSKADGKVTIVGKASAALPGYLMLFAKVNDATGAVESGEWTLTVTRQNGDGSSSETGKLSGTLSGGTITLDQSGAVASVDGVQLSIKNGAGTYASINTGQGRFTGTSQSVPNQPPLIGTLSLTF